MRSEAEAIAALEGGASILDIKEPARGALGAAPPLVRRRIAALAGRFRARGDSLMITAAGGELAESPGPGLWEDDDRITHVKLGLSHSAGGSWEAGLDRWVEGLSRPGSRARVIAVAYADHERAGSPEPRSVLAYAARRRLGFLLIDTFDKRGGSLRSLRGEEEIRSLIETAQERGLCVAIAGSLRREDFEPLLRLGPEIIAVRGAACRGGRGGEVDAARVAALARLVAAERGSSARRSLAHRGRHQVGVADGVFPDEHAVPHVEPPMSEAR